VTLRLVSDEAEARDRLGNGLSEQPALAGAGIADDYCRGDLAAPDRVGCLAQHAKFVRSADERAHGRKAYDERSRRAGPRPALEQQPRPHTQESRRRTPRVRALTLTTERMSVRGAAQKWLD
jgi:hypothetical protein